MTHLDITKAWARIREIDNTIPDDVLDFMKNTALDKLREIEYEEDMRHVRSVMNKSRATGLTPFHLLNTPFYTDK